MTSCQGLTDSIEILVELLVLDMLSDNRSKLGERCELLMLVLANVISEDVSDNIKRELLEL